jgi:CubicO group peptidase (beta-lactamase class C family)
MEDQKMSTQIVKQIIRLIVVVIVLFPKISYSQQRNLSDKEIKIITEMLDKYVQKDLFSGSVLLVKNGKILFNKVYGMSNLERKTKITKNTEFHTGSIGKLFTSAAIFKLADQGKLSIDDNIGKYLDGFSKDISEKVTIRQLIFMTSGMRNYMVYDEFKSNPGKYITTGALLDLIKEKDITPAFEPGTSYWYSNSGYIVLGGIIEKITGMDYFKYIEENIWAPLKMKHTSFFAENHQSYHATGYTRDLNGKYLAADFSHFTPNACGGAYTTAEDLLLFTQKICNNTDFLSEKSKSLYFYGLNSWLKGTWDTIKSNPDLQFGWNGGCPGVSTVLSHLINQNITVIVLSNHSVISFEVAEQISKVMKEGSYNEVEIPIAEKVYATYIKDGIGEIRKKYTNQNIEYALNDIGYSLLTSVKTEEAIQIFAMAVEMYPNSANTYDSLGEAYMNAGNKELAIKNYEKSLELDPNNINAVEQLKKLKTN